MKFGTVAVLLALTILASLAVKSFAQDEEEDHHYLEGVDCSRIEHEVSPIDLDPTFVNEGKIDIGMCTSPTSRAFDCVPTGYRGYDFLKKFPDRRVRIVRLEDVIIIDCEAVPVTTTAKPIDQEMKTEKP